MKTEIEVTIMVPVDIEYEPAEEQTFHNPGWPASAEWIDFDHDEVLKRIETELDKSEQVFLDIVEQEIRDQAGEAAYERWLDKQAAAECLDRR
jgi:hypothetical protein